jgi:peptidoglycan/LPS O-acetylase OafA/YrhL
MAATQAPFYKDPEFLRPQSLLLLLIVALLVVTLFLPLASFQPQNETATTITLTPLSYEGPAQAHDLLPAWSFALAILPGVVLPLVALLAYKDRQRFLRLARITTAYLLLLIFLLLGGVTLNESSLGEALSTTSYHFAILIPLITPIIGYLAILRIRRDIQRVKAMERFW